MVRKQVGDVPGQNDEENKIIKEVVFKIAKINSFLVWIGY